MSLSDRERRRRAKGAAAKQRARFIGDESDWSVDEEIDDVEATETAARRERHRAARAAHVAALTSDDR